MLRLLKQDLDRYKDENEELQASLHQITQSYLQEKAKVQELRARIDSSNLGPATQQRHIDKLVEK